jgi:predicted outer membrane repeat protein
MWSAGCILMGSMAQASTWFVDAAAAPGGSGTGWGSAFNSLDTALSTAVSGDSIWVKQGTYKPSVMHAPPDARSVEFFVQLGSIKIYGGFNGTESGLATRAGLFSTTVLDGDVGVAGNATDNAYHVVAVQTNATVTTMDATIDGFTIINGNANGTGSNEDVGGGIFAKGVGLTLHLANCTIKNNSASGNGGGLRVYFTTLLAQWCSFSDNSAANGGAISGNGMSEQGVSYIVSTVFYSNSATGDGGAIHQFSSPNNSTCMNCEFFANSAVHGGAAWVTGGAVVAGGEMAWSNCTVGYNAASSDSGGIGGNAGAPNPAHIYIHNSILWGNAASTNPQLSGATTVDWSDIQGGATGTGNINANPLFANGPIGRFNLTAGSPAIDAANNSLVIADVFDLDGDSNTTEATPYDVGGGARFVDDPNTTDTGSGSAPIVDMGADEYL